LLVTVAVVAVSLVVLLRLGRDFLPPFNEGAVQINVLLPAGSSLAESNDVSAHVEKRLQQIDDITAFVRKTGRAELDEHAEGVNVTEIVATIDPHSERSREEVIEEISDALADIPGIVTAVEQPIAHLISHMLSGVKAQVAIKLYGDDLNVLRREAQKIETAISGINGVRDLQTEQQALIPQLRIEADGYKLEQFGLRRWEINELIETAMQGEVVSEVLDDQRTFDLLVRLDERYREDIEELKRLVIETPSGGSVKLEDVAKIYKARGPNTINREQVRRRIAVQCNVRDRGLVDVVNDIRQRLQPIEAALPTGYFIEYGGQFESQQSASRTIGILFMVTLVGIFLVLYKMFHSANLSLQVMAAIPMAFIGAVAALVITRQTLTVAAMVGFIALVGVASRNGILLLNHYLHLVKYEGEGWTKEMIVRGGLERLAPVLMTALCAGIALIPLTLAAGEPGKEILYPVATVIVGGLISSTLLDFVVRPALFWTLGLNAARRVVESKEQHIPLEEESERAA
jgi:HME family heavy-metal exporter